MLRGDRIYAYEAGVLRRRYEGIVHKVQMLNVKLGFDMNQYVKHFNLHAGIKTITFPEAYLKTLPQQPWGKILYKQEDLM